MPKDFVKCVKAGGKVITKKVNDKQYMHICYDADGKAHKGEILYKQTTTEKKKSK